MLEQELLSGGNIRFDEIAIDMERPSDNEFLTLCQKMVKENCTGLYKILPIWKYLLLSSGQDNALFYVKFSFAISN